MRLTATMRQLADSRAEMVAATRFFRNPKVTAAEIVATAAAQTAVAAAGRHVLLVEDTSEINFEGKAGRKRGLGRVGNGRDVGLFVHPAIAVDAADGTLLGLAGATLWRRHKAKAEDYQAQPIETKESHRWIVTARTARAALAETPLATVVADREADIYELFARLPEPGPDGPRTHLLVRCHHDRTLAGPGRKRPRLHDTVAAWPEAGRIGFDLDARPGRPARHVTLAVRFGSVRLRQPTTGADPKDPRDLTLNLVEVRETDPPPGQTPILWRLYTSHAVTTLDDAVAIVELYRRRWAVEQVFRTLKSRGLAIEDSFIADGDALENLAATALIAAIRVMQCVHARGQPGTLIPAARVFLPAHIPVLQALLPTLEGKTLKQKNPFPTETLAWATWVIARLGGWKGYASERPPGPITMLNGFQRFDAIVIGFALAQPRPPGN
ncbi:MAG: IS4 family transposase [Caulobacter sp.]|nr:IS4 family transposase [Caulobacter sp.]